MGVLQQPGIISALGFGKEASATPGLYATPTDLLDVESFQVADDPSILQYPVMRQSRNVIQTTRTGIHKVSANFTMPHWTLQGAALFAYGIGKDVITTVVSGTISAVAIPAGTPTNTITLSSALAAPPSGCGKDWVGAEFDLDVGANLEKFTIVAQPTTTTLTVSPATALGHAASAVFSIPVQHCYVEQVGTSKALLSTISLTAQFAQMYQWNLPYAYISKMSLKGDTKNVKVDFAFMMSAIPQTISNPVAITPAAGEAADIPFIMRDGGIILPFSSGGALSQHSRLLSLTWDIDNGLNPREYGGGVQLAEFYVPGERKQAVTWKEDAGQNSNLPDIWQNFVLTQTSTPAFIQFTNAQNGDTFTVHMPNCKVTKYDPVIGMAEPVGFDGALLPLEDGSSGGYGFASRIWHQNGTTALYSLVV